MDFIIDYIKLDILVAQPQSFVYWLFCFSFLKPQPHHMLKRIALLSVIHSVYTDFSVLLLPIHLHLLNSFLTQIVLMFLLFRDLDFRKKVFLLVSCWLFIVAMDELLLNILMHFEGNIAHENLIRDKLPILIQYLYPHLLLILIASWFIRNRNLVLIRKLTSLLIEGEKNGLLTVVALVSFQFILLAVSHVDRLFTDLTNPFATRILIFMLIAVNLIILMMVIRLLIRTKEQAIQTTQEQYVGDINQMFASIRRQRHDFINHVQVIHYFSQTAKFEELRNYVQELVQDTQELNDIGQHASPAVDALIQAKTAVAVGKDIEFTYELDGKIESVEAAVTSDRMNTLGQLIDESFRNAVAFPVGQRRIHATVRFEEGDVKLDVRHLIGGVKIS